MLTVQKDTNEINNLDNKQGSLTEQVYDTILERIINFEIPVGTLIDRKKLAKELGVSMSPLREALTQLTADGYLETYPRKGTLVKPINKEELYGSLMVRVALECQAARMSFGKINEIKRQLLIEKARITDDNVTSAAHWKYEVDFHLTLMKMAGNPFLTNVYKKHVQKNIFYKITAYSSEPLRLTRKNHVKLVNDLFLASSKDEAERLIRAHLDTSVDVLNIKE
jgi:DNA-binding GntR family transcriptional regulator